MPLRISLLIKFNIFWNSLNVTVWRCFSISNPLVLWLLYHLLPQRKLKPYLALLRRSRPEVFCKKDVLKEFTKFTRKPSVFEACNFIKKETVAQVFICEFCEFLNTPFLAEHLRWLLLSIAFVLLNTNLSITLSTFLFPHMQA